mgnify:CR=1 FL=1
MANIMTIRAPDEMQRLLKETSKDLGFTRNALVLQILWEWLKNNGYCSK